MIRPTKASETPDLVAMTDQTAVFRPVEIEALQEVLDDYHAGTAGADHYCVTFEQDAKPIGFAYFAPAEMTDRTWHLWWIVVSPHTQARGIGTQLLQYVENECRRAGGRILVIETGSTPLYEKTRRFYLKHGYEQAGLVRDFYADGDDMVVFRKRLTP